MDAGFKGWFAGVCVVVAIASVLFLAFSPAWSDTGTVVSNTSTFSGTTWGHTIVVSTVYHGNFTFSENGDHSITCFNTPWYLGKGETVGIWQNYFGCTTVVEYP